MLIAISSETSLLDVWVSSLLAMSISLDTAAVEVLAPLFTDRAQGLFDILGRDIIFTARGMEGRLKCISVMLQYEVYR